MKKIPGNIIISRKCTINDNHRCMIPDMKRDGQNFLSFWAIFYPFTSLTVQKIKMKKKNKNKKKQKKNTWRYHHFIIVYQKS